MLIFWLPSLWSPVSATESITAQSVDHSTVLTTLSFSNELQLQSPSFGNYRNFPPVLYGLAEKHREGTISFTKGFWDDSIWSSPSFSTKSSGFELELAHVESEKELKAALNIISGYFCSSISRMKPEHFFVKDNRYFTNFQQEPLCTENLQPFIDLLPCRDVSGLASMLRPEVLHTSEYYSMQIHFQKLADKIIFEAKIFLVNDLRRWNRQGKYSLPSVLGKLPSGVCGQAGIEIFGQSYDLEGIEKINMAIPDFKPNRRSVRVLLFKSGIGDESGGFGVKIENDQSETAVVDVLLQIPWMFRPIWHEADGYALLSSFTLTPAKFDRKSSSFAELQFKVPAKGSIIFHVPFEREYLRIDEFPANSERGIDFPAAKVQVKGVANGGFSSNGLLFTWPTPDGTMPFNVITMSATVVALFHGALFNMLFRRFYLLRPEDPPASPVFKVIWKLKQLFKK